MNFAPVAIIASIRPAHPVLRGGSQTRVPRSLAIELESDTMNPAAIWTEDTIFIEFGLRDVNLAEGLRQAGYEKYLGVSGDRSLVDELREQNAAISDQFVYATQPKLVLKNNAQVLALDGRTMLCLWKYKWVRHAEWVLWRAKPGLASLLALLGCLCHLLFGHYSLPRLVTFCTPDGKRTRMFASRILRRKLCVHQALHFIPHRLGVAGVFREFNERGIEYVVLRWFEKLPSLKPNEDIDMLIADDSLEEALEVLQSQPGIQPCDVYSESGLARSDYCGTPYYPAPVARRLLEGAVLHNGLCRVPNPEDYFHSLAYHAVYHKGPGSDLPRTANGDTPGGKGSHDYRTVLQAMASKLGVSAEISLEGLHEYLQAHGWGPSAEMLGRLAVACPKNQWLQSLAARLDRHVVDQGLAVFVVRKQAVDEGHGDFIIEMIRESGFDILAAKQLTDEEIEFAAARTRGGNWSQGGPFQRSGGPPALAVIAYDRDPLPLDKKQRRRFPERTNARIFIKETIRDEINSRVPEGQSYNALHSSDHATEAWHLIEVLAPELLEPTQDQLRQIYGMSPAAQPLPQRRAA